MIALAPIVADPRLAIDNQRVDLQLLQPRRNRQTGLAAADHQYGGIAFGVVARCVAQIEPVRPAEVARIGLSPRPRGAELFLEPLELVERSEQRPCFQAIAVGGIGHEPHDAAAAADCCLEIEDGFDIVGAGACHLPWRRAVRCELEIARRRLLRKRRQRLRDRIAAGKRLQVPAQRQRIAPKTVGQKKPVECSAIRLAECALEFIEPGLRGDGNILRLIQHARPRGRLRGVSSRSNAILDQVMSKALYPSSDSMWPCSGGMRPFSVSR